ncbi:MAG: c-type cytochrome [Luteolibacter sp.]
MKSKLHFVILLIALSSACSVVEDRQGEGRQRGVSESAPLPDANMATRSGNSLGTLETGHGVYMRKCGECHTHLLPDQVTSDSWHAIVPGMAWNAGIEPAEEEALLAYMLAAKSTP